MLKVGLTGGIGSGKTTVGRIFEMLGIPVYYADDRAKYLIENDENLKRSIIDAFGPEAYTSDHRYNRKYIANIVFKQKDKLQMLNALVHPVVIKDGEQWQKLNASFLYTIKEAALLFESGSYLALDKIIYVYTPEQIRIERIIKRDDLDREEVQRRMASQGNEHDKMEKSDFIIMNDGSKSLIQQVMELHHLFNSLSNFS